MNNLSALIVLLVLSACQSTPQRLSSDPAINELTEYALSLQGTPYRYGGTSPDSGFDCSGFVGHVFKHSLGKTLPRSSADISRIGVSLQYASLKPGDLVFYNTLHKPYSHVGIYLGDSQFIHSPSSGKYVSIVNMNDSYWRARYNGARRLRP
jgi:cell wall-associated NlpC family hydrolase